MHGRERGLREALVLVHQALAQVEDGRGPEANEDTGFAPARHVQHEG